MTVSTQDRSSKRSSNRVWDEAANRAYQTDELP